MGAGLEPESEEKDHATSEAQAQRLEHRTRFVPCVLIKRLQSQSETQGSRGERAMAAVSPPIAAAPRVR